MTSTLAPPRWRLLGSFAVLPVLDAVLGYVVFPAVWWLGGHGAADATRAGGGEPAAGFALIAGVLGALVTLCGAIPAVFWLMSRGTVALRHLVIAGVLLGNVPFAVYAFMVLGFSVVHLLAGTLAEHLMSGSELFIGTLRALAIGSFFGAVSAIAFWFLGIRGGTAVDA